jgi:KamA family protein
LAVRTVGAVLPFKTNEYVCRELIDWDDIPADPIFQLTFPQEGMLAAPDFDRIAQLLTTGASVPEVQGAVHEIRRRLNPHPAGQVDLNRRELDGEAVKGLQHKYAETVLFFPTQGQTCHAYCTYCFRWPQFVKFDGNRFATKHAEHLASYLRADKRVTDVLFTGGDPLTMRTEALRSYIEPLLAPDLDYVNIRIGTKATAYWPQRFVNDDDADDLLRLFERVVMSGRHLAVMAHYSHPRELETTQAREALRRIRATGAIVRCQAPLIRHVNDSAETWISMVNSQVRLGLVPYYMFIERDTGAREYFEVPISQALDIYQATYRQLSGLGRTMRGPIMSATPGKIMVDGRATVGNDDLFVLRFAQSRNPEWSDRVFFAKYDETVAWFDDLEPAFGSQRFFFEQELDAMQADARVRLM